MPTNGETVTLTKPDDNVPITFETPNFMLAAAGTCPANLKMTNNCGHIHTFIDGAACTPDGAYYNNDASASPANAIFSNCPMPNGSHTITMELHQDNHAPVLLNGATTPPTATVMITTTGG
jgi:hypothetical protein